MRRNYRIPGSDMTWSAPLRPGTGVAVSQFTRAADLPDNGKPTVRWGRKATDQADA